MNTTTIDNVLYSVVDKSTKVCNDWNTRHKELIDNGIELPWHPSQHIIEEERKEAERQKVAADNAVNFQKGAKAFFEVVISLMPAKMKELAYIDGNYLKFKDLWGEAKAEVDVYRKFSGYHYSSRPAELRVVVGDYRHKGLYKSKTQDIKLLATETETAKKVFEALQERFNSAIRSHESRVAQQKAEKRAEEVFKANEELFKSFGFYAGYHLRTTSDNKVSANITFVGSPEEWQKLREFLNTLKKP